MHPLSIARARCASRANTPPPQKTAIQQRLDITCEEIRTPVLASETYYQHKGLSLCGFPTRKPLDENATFIRRNGALVLMVQPLATLNAQGIPYTPGIPYGPKARLLMIWIVTQAVRHGSPVLHVGQTVYSLCRDILGDDPVRDVKMLQNQLLRLANCCIDLTLFDGKGKAIQSRSIPVRISLSESDTLFQIALGDDFFKDIVSHARPVDFRVLRALRHSARMMDIYFWLITRLYRLSERAFIRWEALRSQFLDYPETTKIHPRQFYRQLWDDIRTVADVLDIGNNLSATEQGVILTPMARYQKILSVQK